MTEATLRIKVDATDADKASRSLDSLTKSGDKADQTTSKLTDTTKRLAAAATALATSMAVREIVAYADAWQSAENQLRLVTTSTEQLTGVQSALLGVANNTRSSFESTANLYSRLSRATSEMGLSQQELIGITTTINQSFAVSGATAAEAAAAITQLSQGLAAGALRGDEFNSVSEQAPGIMRAIAESLDMTVGELRSFAAEGGITADIVVKALQRSADSIDQDFGKATATFGQSMQVAKNNMLAFVGGSDEVKASVGFAGDAVVFLSENLDTLGAAATGAALIYATTFIPAMVALTGPLGVATAAVIALTSAFQNLQDITDTAKENSISNNINAGAEVITFAMYNVVQEINKARDAMDELGGGRSAKARRAELEEEIASLTAELERYALALEKSIDPADGSAIAAEILRGKVGGLAGTLVRYGEDVKIVREAEDAHVEAMEDYIKAQEEAAKKTENARKKIGEMIGALESETQALDMTARAAAVFEAVTKATADGALPAEIAQVATLTARLYDMGEAKEYAAEAAKKLAEDNKESAREYAEDWRRTHESLSQNIEGLIGEIESGGDAFEFLGDIAVNTAKRIAAEWLALKAMDLFGIKMPTGGGGSVGGSAASSAGNSLINAAVSSGFKALIGGGSSSAMTSAAIGAGGAIGGVGAAVAGGTVAGGVGAAAAGASAGAGAAAGGGMLAGAGAALSSAGSSIMAGLAAIPGWGWAIGAAALAAAALSKKETPSGNAGFLLRPVGDGERQFDVPAFDSGFDPVGFARREDQGAANQVIDVFRADDAVLTALAKASGLDVNYNANNFGGYDEKGRGNGLFFGTANEDGKSTGVSIEEQRTQFVSQWLRGLGGQVDQAVINEALSAGSADAMIAKAAKLAGVGGIPAFASGGYHSGGLAIVGEHGPELVDMAPSRVYNNADTTRMMRGGGSGMDAVVSAINTLRAEMADIRRAVSRSSDIMDEWNGGGLPQERAA